MYRYALLLIAPLFLIADKGIDPNFRTEEKIQPWTTGPLLSPSAYVVPLGHANYEPYIYATALPGAYDGDWNFVRDEHLAWSNTFQPIIQVGLASWLDFQVSPTVLYNYTHHEAKWVLADLPVGFDIQLYQPDLPTSWIPAVKLTLKESFPIGKYNHLNPKKRDTDIGGSGSFETGLGLVFGKLFHFGKFYFMTTRLFMQYTLQTAVRLKGLNTYGGAPDTKARFFPPQNFEVDFALEVAVSRNWVFACDIVGTWFGKPHYSGSRGKNPDGSLPLLGAPGFAVQYSLAPAIEYNWSSSIGIIAGGWFTFAGRNTPAFSSGIIAFNYYQ